MSLHPSSPCVVLLSGGLDSATCLAIAKSLGFAPYCLTVLYGQRHSAEIEASKKVAKALGAVDHRFVSVSLDVFGGSALTADIPVPKDREESEIGTGIPITYVPARNTVFLSLALAYAEVVKATDIMVGVNAVDYSGYPDCRPEFLQAFEKLAQLATAAGVGGNGMVIHAPLISLSKKEIIQRGLDLGVDYGMTLSCYDPGEGGKPCGHCDSCQIRAAAFKELGRMDPILS